MANSVKEYIREITSKGGKARAEALTKKERQEIGRKGGLAKARNAKKARARKEGR
jgi:general stress protein YciG